MLPRNIAGRFVTAHFAFAILIAAALGSGGTPFVFAAQPKSLPESLTDSLINLHGQHNNAPVTLRPAILARLQRVAAERNQLLASLVESDPGAVLQVAVPDVLRRGFPASIRNYIEEEMEMDGDLEILHEDRVRGSRFIYKLKYLGEEYALHFKKDPPTQLKTGHRVRVSGLRINNAIALQSGGNVQALTSIPSNTFGNQRTLVILVNFANKATQPYDINFATNLILNTTSNFFLENSYQQTYLSGVVKGWYTIAMNSPTSDSTCNYSQIANLAEQAAANDGVVLSNYSRRVYAFPSSGCGWWGLGSVGGNPSRAWINGSLQLRVAAHEMGHNFGLYHSHSIECGTAAVCDPTSTNMTEYGDTLDTMGSSAYHYNAFQKERLGWLAYGVSPPLTTVQTSGSYSISPYETVGNDPKALKILKSTNSSTGARTFYYAECRRPLGFDSGLSSNANVLNGFVIHSGKESDGNSSYLYDFTPSSSSSDWSDPALPLGYSFDDPVSGVTITPEAPCGNTANGSVSVAFGGLACLPANPDITMSPSSNQWVTPGGSVSYSLLIKNNDSSGCSTSNFNIASAVPSGWNSNLVNSVLPIAPGETGSTSLFMTAASNAADGFYSFSAAAANASDASYSDTVTGGVVVVSSLNVGVSTNKPTYSRTQYVTLTTNVSINGSALVKATVNLTVTKPNGAKILKSVVTGSNGSATCKFRIVRRDPVGSWQVQANTAASGLSGNATTSFMVQ
jgi:hypothetical protein